MARSRSDLVGVTFAHAPGAMSPVALHGGDVVPDGCTVGPHLLAVEAEPEAEPVPEVKPKARRKPGPKPKAKAEATPHPEPIPNPGVDEDPAEH